MQSILINDLAKIFYGFIFVLFLIYLLYKVNATTQNNLVYKVTSALLADVLRIVSSLRYLMIFGIIVFLLVSSQKRIKNFYGCYKKSGKIFDCVDYLQYDINPNDPFNLYLNR